MTALDTSNLPFLMQLSVFENQIASVDFSANPALRNVYLTQNPLTKIDLSANENIMLLEAINMSNLEEINLKNGYCDDWAEYYIVEGNPALKKVIVDPGYEFEPGDDAVQESSRCQHRNRVGDRPESARETKRGVRKIGCPFSFCLEQGMKACPTTGNR